MGLDPGGNIFDEGDECAQCVDVSFNGETPKYIEAHVQGLIECPFAVLPAPDGVFLLTQNDLFPCRWEAVHDGIGYLLSYEGGFSQMQIAIFLTLFYFQDATVNPCDSSFVNEITECGTPDDQAHSGTVDLFWGPTIGPGP